MRGVAQGQDVGGEARLVGPGGGIAQGGAGRELVARARLAGQHVDRRQLAGGLQVGQRVDATRERTDLHACAVGSKEGAGLDGAVRGVSLGVEVLENRPARLPHGPHLGHRRDRLGGREPQAGADAGIAGLDGDDARAESVQAGEDGLDAGGRDGLDVDLHRAVGIGVGQPQPRQAAQPRIPALPQQGIDQVRVHLQLRRGARGLFAHQHLDLGDGAGLQLRPRLC